MIQMRFGARISGLKNVNDAADRKDAKKKKKLE